MATGINRRKGVSPVPSRRSTQGGSAPLKKKNCVATTTNTAPASLWIVLKMLGCTAGIYMCFFRWSVVHEKVSSHPYTVDGKEQKFRDHLVTSLIGGAMTSFIALTALVVAHAIGHPVRFVSLPMVPLAFLGLTQTFSGPLGMAAAKDMSYPLYLSLKMCKMIPTVVVGVLWYRTSYTGLKYLAVLLITGGVACFSVLGARNDTKGAVNTQQAPLVDVDDGKTHTTAMWAVLTCFLGLTLDGYTSSTQDSLFARVKSLHFLQLMLVSGMAVVATCLTMLSIGEVLPPQLHTSILKPELFRAASFFTQAPQAFWDILQLASLNACGQLFVYSGISLFGSLTITAILVTRKLGSVAISIAVHGHSVSMEQLCALVVVAVGVVVDTVDGVLRKQAAALRKNK